MVSRRPTLYQNGIAGASRNLAQWADSILFWTTIPFTMQPAGLAHMFEGVPPEAVKAFGDDRNVFRANLPRTRPADATAAFVLYLERLEATLGKQSFFFGSAPSIADLSIYHCLWFVVRGGPVAKILESFPAVQEWRGHSPPLSVRRSAKVATRGATARAPAGPAERTHGARPPRPARLLDRGRAGAAAPEAR